MTELDRHIFFTVYSSAPPWPWLWFMAALSAVGGGWGLLGTLPFLARLDTRRAAARLLLVLLATAIAVFALKAGLGRVRPCSALEGVRALVFAPPHDPSFPSGHAAGSFAFAAYLARRDRPYRSLALFLAASCVALSRVVLGVHFPADVTFGAALGTCFGLVGARISGLPSRVIWSKLRP